MGILWTCKTKALLHRFISGVDLISVSSALHQRIVISLQTVRQSSSCPQRLANIKSVEGRKS